MRTGLRRIVVAVLPVPDAILPVSSALKREATAVNVWVMTTSTKKTVMKDAPVAVAISVLKILVAKAVAVVTLAATAMTERRARVGSWGR
jgi:hypothetical protein